MPGLHSLRDENLPANNAAPTQALGSYAYGLNIFLPATSGVISTNSKRMDCRFRLASITSAFLGGSPATNWSIRLGTVRFDWFSEFVRAETILGDAVLPHFIPEGSQIIECGDSIVVQTRNDESVAKRIALLFQGEHIL